MKIRKDFEEWLAALCDYYTRGAWFTPENVDACWRDIRGVELDALEDIGKYIRSHYVRWTDGFSVSGAIHKAWSVVGPELARAKAKDAEAKSPAVTNPTPEQWERHNSRLKDVMAALKTGLRPHWMKERPDDHASDSYHRRPN